MCFLLWSIHLLLVCLIINFQLLSLIQIGSISFLLLLFFKFFFRSEKAQQLCGWFFKQGEYIRSRKRRFFTRKSRVLEYYKSIDGKPCIYKGFIDLDRATCIENQGSILLIVSHFFCFFSTILAAWFIGWLVREEGIIPAKLVSRVAIFNNWYDLMTTITVLTNVITLQDWQTLLP